MILSRQEFIDHLNIEFPGEDFGQVSHPVWSYELYAPVKSNWFIKTQVVEKSASWDGWTFKGQKGTVLCYISDNTADEEWWGFSDKDDIVFWLLKFGHR
jgi:hypothetical protein